MNLFCFVHVGFIRNRVIGEFSLNKDEMSQLEDIVLVNLFVTNANKITNHANNRIV